MEKSCMERRNAARGTVMLAATISHAGSTSAVTLRNLSEKGIRAEGEALPGSGSTVLLGRNGTVYRGEVVWVGRGEAGIRFENPPRVEALLRRISRPHRQCLPRQRRSGLKCEPLTEADKRNWERWVTLGPTAAGD
jgi:hypothetical protein